MRRITSRIRAENPLHISRGRQAAGESEFAFHVWIGSRARAEAIVARYPVGSVVTVYHHPDRPEQAVLELENAGLSVGLAAFAGLLFIGIVAAWWSVSRAVVQ